MAQLGYYFADQQLLEVALRHRSFGYNNNERLEFLGDALVNFFVGEWLFQSYPNSTEGRLSRMRASLVNGETLAQVARDFAIGDYLRLGQGELKSGGFRRDSILADAMEAVIGAVYLDGGFHDCRERVITWYGDRLRVIAQQATQKDAKTQLQEALQGQRLPLPDYEVTKIEGESHNQTFHVQCSVKGIDFMTHGQAGSRRKAEQTAAQRFLKHLQQGET